MIVVRSNRPLTISGRNERQGIIALHIIDFVYEARFDRYKIRLNDYEVIDKDPSTVIMVGDNLKEYRLLEETIRYRSKEEVNQMFNHFAIDIVNGDDFTAKLTDLQNKALLLDTQMNPIYGSTAQDWEIIDTNTEVKE